MSICNISNEKWKFFLTIKRSEYFNWIRLVYLYKIKTPYRLKTLSIITWLNKDFVNVCNKKNKYMYYLFYKEKKEISKFMKNYFYENYLKNVKISDKIKWRKEYRNYTEKQKQKIYLEYHKNTIIF